MNKIKCGRGVCNNDGKLYNASTEKLYCECCAKLINETAPRLCDTVKRTYKEWKKQLTIDEIIKYNIF